MNDALTCRSLNSLKRSGWARDRCLKRWMCSCDMIYSNACTQVQYGQIVHLCHLFSIQSNAIFLFYGSLYIYFGCADSFICLIHRVVAFTGCAAIWEALPPTGAFCNCSVWNTELRKNMISYLLKYNIYRYFPLPVYRSSLNARRAFFYIYIQSHSLTYIRLRRK